MQREGVTVTVNAAMEAVQANVLQEDGLLLRTCAHGIQHPVGHLHREVRLARSEQDHGDERSHSRKALGGLIKRVDCDGCCAPWLLGVPVTVDAVDPDAERTTD